MEYSALSGVQYRNTLHALLTIARTERIRGLFSGLVPTLLRDAPYSGLYLLFFTHFRGELERLHAPQPGASFVAAAAAGGLATLLTHPPDVIRTRLQLRNAARMAVGRASFVALPAVHVGAIIRNEGILALWSGVAPRVARRMLQQAMTWRCGLLADGKFGCFSSDFSSISLFEAINGRITV